MPLYGVPVTPQSVQWWARVSRKGGAAGPAVFFARSDGAWERRRRVNRSNLRILLHVAIALMVLSGAALAAPDSDGDSDSDSDGPKTETVKVKCNEGQSIAKALENKADFLIVEIQGFCEEKITINRSGVTLRGSDPEKDGLMGPADPVEEPLVTVTGANTVLRATAAGFQDFSVTIENLGFVGNDASALLVWDSLIRAANVRFTDNTGRIHRSAYPGISPVPLGGKGRRW